MTSQWVCYARPASTGKTCFFANKKNEERGGFCTLSCEKCGCEKGASDARLRRGDVDGSKN